VKITSTSKRLADESRSDDRTIAPYELAGCLGRKGKMRDASNHKRIDNAQKHRCDRGVKKSCD
jgi:hypothetical protein